MKPKPTPKPRPARRPVAAAPEVPAAEEPAANQSVERQRPDPADLQRGDEPVEGSIESVSEGEAAGGVEAPQDEDAMRPRMP